MEAAPWVRSQSPVHVCCSRMHRASPVVLCWRPGMRPMLGLRLSAPSLVWWGREHREFRVQMHRRMRHTIATAIERERYGIGDPDPPLLQCPRSAVLPRSSSMALLQPSADRAHVWQGDAPQRKCLSEMYDDHDRGAAEAVAEAVSCLRTMQSLWFLRVRRETNVMF
jgi:hypothetical protein